MEFVSIRRNYASILVNDKNDPDSKNTPNKLILNSVEHLLYVDHTRDELRYHVVIFVGEIRLGHIVDIEHAFGRQGGSVALYRFWVFESPFVAHR